MHTIIPPPHASTSARRWASPARALLAVAALAALAASPARAEVVFTRNTQTAESWALYTATFTPASSGGYTLGFNLTAGGPSGDNSILIDAVQVTNGATVVFADGFETPNLATNTGSSANGGTATIGKWVFNNSSGILDGSPPNWGLAGQGLGSADGTTQYGFFQAAGGFLGNAKAAQTLPLVAGQTYTISFYQASRRDFGGTTSYTVTLDFVPPTVFASGISEIIAWDPIFPASILDGQSESKPVPTVGYDDPRWTNPHPASVFPKGSHPWETGATIPAVFKFDANWINAWPNLAANGAGGPGQSWTLYSTMVTGEGDFVLQFLADNASWIYIDGQLVAFQDWNWPTNGTGRFTISLTGPGPHELSFVIWDGGGLAGGKFRLETTQSFIDNGGGELPPPPPPADTTAPLISAPANLTAEATSAAGAAVTFAATAVDDVDGPVAVLASPASGSTFPLGITTVNLLADDAAGNVAAAAFTVKVQDTIAPVLTVPANLAAEATSAAGAAVTYPAATATDAVGVASLTHSAASGSTFALGATTVTVNAADAAGNASNGSFTVTVRDTIAPALTVPASLTAEATSAAGAAVTYPAATATDAVGVASLTHSAASGSTFALGATTVTVNAADAAGNASNGSFTVTVRDTTAPALTVPANLTAEATSAAGAAVSYPAATATDAVGVASLTYSAASGSTFALGATTVAVNAADAAGNASTGAFTVTVQDTTAPTITSVTPSIRSIWPPNKKMVPVTVSLDLSDAVGVASAKIVSVATNQPDSRTQWEITGPLAVNLLADRRGDDQDRIYTITVEVRDAAGNVSTATTTVTVPHDQRDNDKDSKDDDDHDDKDKGDDKKDDGKKDDGKKDDGKKDDDKKKDDKKKEDEKKDKKGGG